MPQESNTPNKPVVKFPKDGDRILITFAGHRSSWHGPFIYRKRFDDPVRGEVRDAIIYAETWSNQGQLAYHFEELEFWCRWEGESLEGYEKRKEKIIEELRRQHLPIDPIDSFIGENSIQGEWSPPKIGPAFQPIPVEGNWTRPKNGAIVEVHAVNHLDTNRGIFLQATDSIYSKSRLIEVQNLLTGEATYSNRFRYGVPELPFADWIRFRVLAEDGTPKSDWLAGPHFKEWFTEERARQVIAITKKNEQLFEQRAKDIRQMLEIEPVLSVRMIRLEDIAGQIDNERFDTSLEPDGNGEFFRNQLYSVILTELWVVDRAFQLDHPAQKSKKDPKPKTGSKVTKTKRPIVPPLAFRTVWIKGIKDSKLVKLNEALRDAKLLDEEGRWVGILEYLGGLIRILGEKGFIHARRQVRYNVKETIFVRQRNGSFTHPTEAQLDNAYKRARYGVAQDIKRIIELLTSE